MCFALGNQLKAPRSCRIGIISESNLRVDEICPELSDVVASLSSRLASKYGLTLDFMIGERQKRGASKKRFGFYPSCVGKSSRTSKGMSLLSKELRYRSGDS
jgi:hypothetical protein